MTMYFVLSTFTYTPVRLLATTDASVSSPPPRVYASAQYHQHKLEAYVHHLITRSPGFPEPSLMAYSKEKLKNNRDKAASCSNHSQ